MELNTIKQTGTWGDASERINENFTKMGVAIESIKDATTRNKGYYATASALNEAFPTAPSGSKAYVGTSYPYAIYTWDGSAWVNSGKTGGEESLELGEYYNKTEADAKIANATKELQDQIDLLTPIKLDSEEAHDALVASGDIVEGQIYYTTEE